MEPLSVLINNSNTCTRRVVKTNTMDAQQPTLAANDGPAEHVTINSAKKSTTATIDFELNEANTLRLGMECQPRGNEPAAVKCTRNEPIKRIAKLVEIITKQKKYDKNNAPAVEYYCRITGEKVPEEVVEIMRENKLEPLGSNPPDYIASVTNLFPSIIKAKRFTAYYNKMTGENLQEKVNKINSFFPGFLEHEEKQAIKRKTNRKGRDDDSTKTKLPRGRNNHDKRSTINKLGNMQRNSHTDGRDDIESIVTSQNNRVNPRTIARVGYHPVSEFRQHPTHMLPVGINIPVNTQHLGQHLGQLGQPINGLAYSTPLTHTTQTANIRQISQMPGFHGVQQLPYHINGTSPASDRANSIRPGDDPSGRGYYTTFYYDG